MYPPLAPLQLCPPCPVGDVAAAGSWASGGQVPPSRCSPSSSPGPPQRRRGPFPGAVPLSRPRPPGARPAQRPSGRDTLGDTAPSLRCRPHPRGRAPSSAGLQLGSAFCSLSSAKPLGGVRGGGVEPCQHPAGKSQTVIEARERSGAEVGSALRETISVVTFLHVGGAAVPQVWLSECA